MQKNTPQQARGLRKSNILWFKEITIKDIPAVGGKNASLGEMYSKLTKEGIKIPNGFAVTAYAYQQFIKEAGIEQEIKDILKDLDTHNVRNLMERGAKVRKAILKAKLPEQLKTEITQAYKKLSREYKSSRVDVAVRSSATAEDLPSISEDEHIIVKIDGKIYYRKMKEIYDLVGGGRGYEIEIPALDDNEIRWCKVKEIYKHKTSEDRLYKITTVTGREITVSPNHTLIVLDERTLKPSEVASIGDLEGNEKLPVIKKLPEGTLSIDDYLDFLDYIEGDDVVEDNGLIKIKNKSSNWKIQHGLPSRIYFTKDFAYFLGIYLAEGSTYRNNCVMITNSDREVMSRVISFCKSLRLYNRQKVNRSTLRVYCKSLVRFLHIVTGEPIGSQKGKGRSCRIKKIPEFVFEWNIELIGEFLRGCFDGDGYVSHRIISYTSTSEMLIGGIVKLLEILGVEFYLRKRSKSIDIVIPYHEAESFRNLVGFTVKSKVCKLDQLIENYKKTKNIQFKNRININEFLSKEIKEHFIDSLPKKETEINVCPSCKKEIERSSYYKGKERFYCRFCHKTFYETPKQIQGRYIYYDKRGRFKKGMSPWNKAIFSGSFGTKKLREVVKSYKIGFFDNLLASKSVLWDQIKKIEPIDYSEPVYDFVVPGVENFAAGIGGIITHNSASFAGQQETYLNIKGEHDLLSACKKCFASLFTNRAISYREDKGFDHFQVSLSIGVQKMVRADKGASGVTFTIDTESGFRDVVLVNSIYGLGENIVQGKVTPDEYYVFKTTLKQGFKPIISKRPGDKKIKMVYSRVPGKGPTKNIPVPKGLRKRYAITDDEVLKLAKWGMAIEEHYKKPMDIEWAKDGITGELYVVQARPETVQALRDVNVLEEYRLIQKGKILIQGKSVGNKIGAGKVNVIKDTRGIHSFQKSEVLVTEMTNPDWEPIMKIAAGIVTNSGGRTCHAAIVSRELGIPCIVGTEDGTKVLKTGQEVTVDCSGGEQGFVYQGKVKYKVNKTNLKTLKQPKTKIMMNIGNPEEAMRESFIPNDGVGLAREEFIISSYIGVHPLALVNFDKIKDKSVRQQIEEKTREYKKKTDYYIYELAEGIAQIAAAFYPKDVIVRLSDFKTNEYATLLGGKYFEPEESNPMIGWRGASRYYDEKFKPAFELECYALKRVREVMGLINVKIMVPFCRTVEEGKKVLKIMEKCGLKRGKDGLEVYVMCEIPSNVILAQEFFKIFDGFSIGSNDLTQLVLGVDRDSEIVAHVYDERNKAVKDLVRQVIKAARENGKKIGICGQAPSDFPDFAQFLVECGIDSISLISDTVVKTTVKVLEKERALRM